MQHRICGVLTVAVLATSVFAAEPTGKGLTSSLTMGNIELKSAGPLAFGPEGILFIGDPQAATLHALDTGDTGKSDSSRARPRVEGIDEKIAGLLGCEPRDVQIKDLAVNPLSGNTYLSVSRGQGRNAASLILRVSGEGKLSEVGLKNVRRASTAIRNAVEGKNRQEAITHIAYVKGRVLIAGLSNEEFASKLRSIPFPFDKTETDTSVEIFHGAHGRFETRSPIRVFAPYKIGGEDNILAAYTCTPLVKLPLSSLEPGKKLVASTVAELGNRNRPLSMIVYNKGGKDFVLLANSARGLMKIPLEGIASAQAITKPVKGTAGLGYETIKSVEGVQKLDAFDRDNALVLIRSGDKLNLQTIELP